MRIEIGLCGVAHTLRHFIEKEVRRICRPQQQQRRNKQASKSMKLVSIYPEASRHSHICQWHDNFPFSIEKKKSRKYCGLTAAGERLPSHVLALCTRMGARHQLEKVVCVASLRITNKHYLSSAKSTISCACVRFKYFYRLWLRACIRVCMYAGYGLLSILRKISNKGNQLAIKLHINFGHCMHWNGGQVLGQNERHSWAGITETPTKNTCAPTTLNLTQIELQKIASARARARPGVQRNRHIHRLCPVLGADVWKIPRWQAQRQLSESLIIRLDTGIVSLYSILPHSNYSAVKRISNAARKICDGICYTHETYSKSHWLGQACFWVCVCVWIFLGFILIMMFVVSLAVVN